MSEPGRPGTPRPRERCGGGIAAAAMAAVFAFAFAAPALAADAAPATAPTRPLPQACRDMAGTYAAADIGRSENYRGLVAELAGDADYVIGKPLLRLEADETSLSRVGAISGERMALEPAARGAAVSLFDGARIVCALSDQGSGGEVQIAQIDLSAATLARRQGLADYLVRFWDVPLSPERLSELRYFLVIDRSMSGVAAIFIALPLQKLEPQPSHRQDP